MLWLIESHVRGYLGEVSVNVLLKYAKKKIHTKEFKHTKFNEILRKLASLQTSAAGP